MKRGRPTPRTCRCHRQRHVSAGAGRRLALARTTSPQIASRAVREITIKDTLSGDRAGARAAPAAAGRDLRLRADRLLADPRRQRAAVRHLHAAAPLPRARGLRADAGHQRHRRQRQDLRRGPRGGRQLGRARRRDDRRLHRGHRPPRPRPPRRRAARDRDDRRDRRPDRGADRVGHAYESGGDVYFRVRSFDGYGKLSNRDPDEMDQGEEAGTRRAQGEPARLRALEGAQARRGQRLGLAVGRGAARAGTSSARRWPRRCSAPTSRSTAAARTCLPPPRERDRADRGGARRAARADLDAQRDDPDGRGEDVEVGRQHLPALRGDRPLRRRGRRRLPDLRPLPPAARVLRAGARPRPAPGSSGSATTSPTRRHGEREDDRSWPRRRDGVPRRPRRRLQHPARLGGAVRAGRRGQPPAARRRARGARGAARRCSASSRCCAGGRPADAEAEALLAEREAARAERDFERADELRDELGDRAGRSATRAEGATLAALRAETLWPSDGEIVYGRRPVAEARRGRRRVRREWTADDTRRPSELTGSPARPTTRGSSPRSTPIPTRTRRALLDRPERAGRRPRPGPGPAQPRRRRPLGRGGRRRRPRDPASGARPRSPAPSARRRRAPSSTCRSRGSRTSPTGSPRAKDAGAWIYGADADAEAPYAEADLTGRPCSCSARGEGAAAAGSPRRCDVLVSIPVRGRVGSLNVSAAAAVLRLRGAAPARGEVVPSGGPGRSPAGCNQSCATRSAVDRAMRAGIHCSAHKGELKVELRPADHPEERRTGGGTGRHRFQFHRDWRTSGPTYPTVERRVACGDRTRIPL